MQILTIRVQILTIQTKFGALKGIRSIWMQIRTSRMGFEAFESKFEPF